MENVLELSRAKGISSNKKHALPNTDSILGRSVNLSIGVVDPGIGADFGINLLSSEEEIIKKAEEFVRLAGPVLN